MTDRDVLHQHAQRVRQAVSDAYLAAYVADTTEKGNH